MWGPTSLTAFNKMKTVLSTAAVLTFYNATKSTIMSADVSNYGLGGVLLQQHGEDWLPVAYCSRRLTEAEKRYAQTEKECLASGWACERLDKYLLTASDWLLTTDLS